MLYKLNSTIPSIKHTEYSRLKGEREAVEKVVVKKKCGMQSIKEQKVVITNSSLNSSNETSSTKQQEYLSNSIEDMFIKLKSLRA